MTYLIALCAVCALTRPAVAQQPSAEMPGTGPNPALPQPDRTSPVRKYLYIVCWPEGRAPTTPWGFRVTAFATGLENPRWLYVLPNGDVLVAEARSHPRSDQPATQRQGMIGAGSIGVSANRITLLGDADGDGVPETRSIFLQNLNQPLGMALVGDTFIVANTDGVMRFPYREDRTRIDSPGEIILLEIKLDGSGERIFASGLRNPVGMGADYGCALDSGERARRLRRRPRPRLHHSVRENGFYGWPYSYFGQNKDPAQGDRRPDLVARAIVPDYALGSHTASLGLTFCSHASFPERYRGGAFVGQRGSWNGSRFSGYKVIFVPFRDGKPAGPAEDFLTGFMANPQTGEAHGRPVGLAVTADGSLLVADDAGNTVWRVQAVG